MITLLNAVTGTGAGTPVVPVESPNRVFYAKVVGSGVVTATVLVEVSLNGSDYLTLASFSLSGTTSDSDAFVSDASWIYVRGNISDMSGTGAAVTLLMGI